MPGDTRTHLARLGKKTRRTQGDLSAMRGRLWRAVEAAEAVLMDAADENDTAVVLKAVHALTQATGAFARLVEVGELEARLAELEKAAAARGAAGTRDSRSVYAGLTPYPPPSHA